MKKLLAILLVLALSLGMLPMALADEPTVLTIGSIITKRDLDKNVLIQRIAEKLNAKIEFTYYRHRSVLRHADRRHVARYHAVQV